MEGLATLEEIETYYSMKDVLDAHEALDIRHIMSQPTDGE